MNIRKLSAADGTRLWVDSWKLSKNHWVSIFGLCVLLLAVSVLVQLVPFIGSILLSPIQAVISFGSILVARELSRGQAFRASLVLGGFSNSEHRKSLIPLIVVWLGMGVVNGALTVIVKYGVVSMVVSASIQMFISAIGLMAFWFVAPLMCLEKKSFAEATHLNWRAILKNMTAFGVFGFWPLMLIVLAELPLGIAVLPIILNPGAPTGDGMTPSLILATGVTAFILVGAMVVFGPAGFVSSYVVYDRVFEKETKSDVPPTA